MAELVTSPFADKLKEAIAGRVIPKASSVEGPKVVDSVVPSGQNPQSEPKREEGESKGESQGNRSGGVGSGAVHQRARLPEAQSTKASTESDPNQTVTELMADITERAETLRKLGGFADQAGYTAEGDDELRDGIARHLSAAEAIAQSRRDTDEPFTPEEVERLRVIQLELSTEMNDMREALVGLEDSGQLTLPTEIKGLLDTPSPEPSAETLTKKRAGDAVGNRTNNWNTKSQSGPNKDGAGSKRHPNKGTEAKDTGKTSPEPLPETKPGEEMEAQLVQLRELVDRWKKLEAGMYSDLLWKILRSRWNGRFPSLKDAEWWFPKSGKQIKWGTHRRAQLEATLRETGQLVDAAERVVKDLREKAVKVREEQAKKKTTAGKPVAKGAISQSVAAKAVETEPPAVVPDPVAADQSAAAPGAGAEHIVVTADIQREPAALDLPDPAIAPLPAGDQAVLPDPVEPEPKTNVRVLRTGRPITNLDDMTLWERVNSREQNLILFELRSLKAEYMEVMMEELQKNSFDPVDAAEVVSQSLRTYLSEAIPNKIPDIELTASDIETLMAELMKEDFLTKPE